MAQAEGLAGRVECLRATAVAIVRHHSLDSDAHLAIPGHSGAQEGHRVLPALALLFGDVAGMVGSVRCLHCPGDPDCFVCRYDCNEPQRLFVKQPVRQRRVLVPRVSDEVGSANHQQSSQATPPPYGTSMPVRRGRPPHHSRSFTAFSARGGNHAPFGVRVNPNAARSNRASAAIAFPSARWPSWWSRPGPTGSAPRRTGVPDHTATRPEECRRRCRIPRPASRRRPAG